MTGVGFGGNKVRHFEFLLADAQAQGADVVLAGFAAQSNFCRQLAASAAKLGLETRLALRVIRSGEDARVQGNLLLDLLAGAEVTLHDMGAAAQQNLVDLLFDDLRAAGRKPYVPARHPYLGAISYVSAGVELARQLQAVGEPIGGIYIASSGGESQAGLVVAMRALGKAVPIIGVNPGVDWWDVQERAIGFANAAAEALELELSFGPDDLVLADELDPVGYGVTSASSIATLRKVAELEGLYLDPVYTSKAMAVMLKDVSHGQLQARGPVVFVHTGGLPALFHYAEELTVDALPVTGSELQNPPER
jgi:1-aminocyclopropane-1-carboxylate deaminase/D-cysteine desulfhydrase-like pyridoxal-dependent ACC family enzyme